MTHGNAGTEWQRSIVLLSGTVIAVVAVSVLYWGQAIFIPVALAIFLTFLLNPIVSRLRVWGVPRQPAVFLTVFAAALVLGLMGWIVTVQLSSVVRELPEHTATLKTKIKSLKTLSGGTSRFAEMVTEINRELKGTGAASEEEDRDSGEQEHRGPERPKAVVVEPESPVWLGRIAHFLSPMMEILGELALAIILVIFMLEQREEFRNRVIRLVGYSRIASATKFVDEAAQRVSRFLLMQALVNGSFGLVLGFGLLALGVKYALLWGFLGALLRYLPYIGPVLAAILPVSTTLALTEGWTTTVLVLVLFVALELLIANFIEPKVYGQSIGVSAIALLVSAAFWAFLWGPIGLLLSSPLTLYLVMLGRYVPQLEFLAVLLGDEPALAPEDSFYQRLLARDQDEAEDLVLARTKTEPPEQIFDSMIVPALCSTRQSRLRGEITDADELAIMTSLGEIIDDLGEARSSAAGTEIEAAAAESSAEASPQPRVVIFGCPARDAVDSVALQMLEILLDRRRWRMRMIAPTTLTAELLELIEREDPGLVCIASLAAGGVAHTRYLCKRLSRRFPDLRIVVVQIGDEAGATKRREALESAGASTTAFTLLDARQKLDALLPLLDAARQRCVLQKAI